MTSIADIVASLTTCITAKRFGEAEAICKDLPQQIAEHPEILNLRGIIDHQLGRTDLAVAKISLAIQKDKKAAQYYLNLARIQQSTGEFQAAESTLQKAIAHHPKLPIMLFLLAEVRVARNKTSDAILIFKRALAIEDANAKGHAGLARAYCKMGQWPDAIVSYQRALKLSPANKDLLVELGDAHKALDQLDDTIVCYMQALEIDPRMPGLYDKIARLYMSIFDYANAVKVSRAGIQMNPRDIACHVDLGLALFSLGKNKEATESLRFAAKIDPTRALALNALAVLAQFDDDVESAFEYYRKTLEADPSFAMARYNRALMNLRLGNLQEGAAEYESRWEGSTSRLQTKRRPFRFPYWTGEDLKGRKLLVWGEQGLGDEIRTASMIPDLQAQGVKIVYECEPRLVSLFQRSFTDARVVERKTPSSPETQSSDISYQIAADSLVGLLRPSFESFPKHPRFLVADRDRAQEFKATLSSQGDLPRVGISWLSKNAQFGQGKSTSLLDWAPVLKQKGIQFIDLQYSDVAADRDHVAKSLGVDIVHVPNLDLKDDIDGLAALITACDLVITISNTTAHLAGALGVPTWVMTASGYFQTWPWFSERRDSPWYPSVKLYRQRTHSVWTPLIAEIAQDLKAWAS